MNSSLVDGGIFIEPELLDKIAAFAALNAERFGERFAGSDGKNRLGGVIAIFRQNGDQLLLKSVGSPDAGKKNDYRTNASLKCIGMFNRKADVSCVSSWTFRDHNASPPCYGGGIRLSNGDFMSFSGFPELWDEAFCLGIAKKFDLLADEREMEIVQVSGNSFMNDVDAWMAEAA